MLERGLGSRDSKERQGVCIGLSEIIQQTSRDNVLLYIDSLLPTIRSALCDDEQDVRAAAAQTFDSLHSTMGESFVPFPFPYECSSQSPYIPKDSSSLMLQPQCFCFTRY